MASIKIESFEHLESLIAEHGIENIECSGTPFFGGASFGFRRLGSLVQTDDGYGYESKCISIYPANIKKITYWSHLGMLITDLHVSIPKLADYDPVMRLVENGQLDLFGGIPA